MKYFNTTRNTISHLKNNIIDVTIIEADMPVTVTFSLYF